MQGLAEAKAAKNDPRSVSYLDQDYLIRLTEANIQRWLIVRQTFPESELCKMATRAEADTTRRADAEGEAVVEWSHSFTITPELPPTLQELLKTGKLGTTSILASTKQDTTFSKAGFSFPDSSGQF